MKLTDEQRKRLTRYLGEGWCEPYLVPVCGEKESFKTIDPNRTFDNWTDLGVLKEKIEEKGEWGEFYDYSKDMWMSPSRFFALVLEWLEGKEVACTVQNA
jgi:hypothetical protein